MTTKSEESPAHGQNMEEKILSAAERLFFRKGFSMTSTTEIAREAGCNQALVHYYYRTKEKLFQAVLGGKVKNAFRQFISMEVMDGTFTEKLVKLIGIHYDTIRENSDMALFLITEFTRNPGMFSNVLDEVRNDAGDAFTIFKRELEEEISAGRIRPIAIEDLILNVVSLNVFLFIVKPVFGRIWNVGDEELEALINKKKSDVADFVLNSLRP
ncbi:MAG: TetR/AcrR family transcriptional regulator [Alistipes sp.]|nr:TetR/AcrR family transcriptional regulator [Alistipes sp.]